MATNSDSDPTQGASNDAAALWDAERRKPWNERERFPFGQIAARLARQPGRLEFDQDEAYRILNHLIGCFERGEFADDEVVVLADDSPRFCPLKPRLEEVEQECSTEGPPILQFWRDAAMLTRPALRRFLEHSTLGGAPRLLREWYSDEAISQPRAGCGRRPATNKNRDTRPTAAQLDEWMKHNAVPGNKRDVTVADRRSATKATVRDAIAAWRRLPANERLERGQRTLAPQIDH